jgi:hypothetical protein
MYTTILSTFLAFGASAAPAPAPAAAPRAVGQSFSPIALATGTSIQYAAIHASGHAFYIGVPTSSSCPLSSTLCPSGTTTAFTTGTNGTLFMDVAVPGGQQVYIDSTGQLKYTVAHSAAIPEGAAVTGFVYEEAGTGESVGSLTFGVDGIYACPNGEEGVYQIFVDTGIQVPGDCVGLSIGASKYDGEVAAWEYD